jgi:hypothetical protein
MEIIFPDAQDTRHDITWVFLVKGFLISASGIVPEDLEDRSKLFEWLAQGAKLFYGPAEE